MENIIDGIQQECNRVRDQLLPAYREIGPAGTFGILVLTKAIEEGEAAIASGDIVRMIAAYKELKDSQ